MTELLPCPFCGGEAKVGKYCDMCSAQINFKCEKDTSPNAWCLIGERVFWVEHKCSVMNPDADGEISTACYASAIEAITDWNTRVAV